jgi:AcrR family transcriptional regulator
MSATTRSRLSPDERRAQLVALGKEMLSTRPIDEVSIDDIAAGAGISRGLLFHYFATKRDFHVAVATAAAEEMLSCLAAADTESLQGLDRLRASLAALIEYVDTHRAAYLSLVRGAMSGDPAMQALFEWTRARVTARVLEGFGYQPDGPAVVPLAVRGWVGFVEDTVTTWLQGDGLGIERDDLLELLERSLLALIRAALDVA